MYSTRCDLFPALLSVLSGGLVMTSLGLSLSLSVFADLGRVEDLGFAGLVALVSSKILGLESCCD